MQMGSPIEAVWHISLKQCEPLPHITHLILFYLKATNKDVTFCKFRNTGGNV